MVSIKETNLVARVCEERLVVLIPDQLEDVANFARQVYWMAAGQERDVLYLALNNREADALANTRLLATLEALTQSPTLKVQSLQIEAECWSDALRMAAQAGDIVICPELETLAARGAINDPLGSAIERELGVRLQFLPEVYSRGAHVPRWVGTMVSWVTGLLILVGFSFLEFRLAGALSGGLRKTVLVLMVTLEFGVLYFWNKVFA